MMVDLPKLIADYEAESRIMLRCADLNPRETGLSYYAQRAVKCAKLADALKTVQAEHLR